MKKNINILYVITSLGVGGAENLLADVCCEFSGRHNITVFYILDHTNFVSKIKSSGAKVIFRDYTKLGFVKVFRDLRRIIKQERIDIVHTHLPAADTLGRLAALSCPGVKAISTIHNSDLWKLRNTPVCLLLRIYNRFTINCFKRTCLIAVSHSVKDFCIEKEKIKSEKITVVYNGINFDNPAKSIPGFVSPLPEDCFSIIIPARMEPYKGHILLLKAALLLIRENRIPNLRVMLMGAGSEEKNLRDFVEKENISENIMFLGFRSNLYDYMRVADLMVLPSQIEGHSITVLESFYCGTPVLASDIPANNEQLCGGKNGLLFPLEGGETVLADMIQDFYEGGKDRNPSYKENALSYCLSHSMPQHVEELETLYCSIISGT